MWLLLALAATLPTELRRVSPEPASSWVRGVAERKHRAVVLIHGMKVYPLRPPKAAQALLHDWQEPGSALVRELSKDADVFAFAFGQTLPVDLIAHAPALRRAVAKFGAAGYREVVLIGHSAGGVIARVFAEHYPDGLTKVILVATPHAGSEIANTTVGYAKCQAPFVHSLAPDVRAVANRKLNRVIAPRVQAVCVVSKLRGIDADGLLTVGTQWPPLLQQQGIPAVLVHDSHWTIIRTPVGVRAVAGLVRDPLVRWSPEQVEVARKVLFGDDEK
ncbi:MAG TPA: alpha/beta fold hydrolase [Gemmataceae bacterium]|nr:alpha/beta fold hydrolase [Gemmataceae bacterium]